MLIKPLWEKQRQIHKQSLKKRVKIQTDVILTLQTLREIYANLVKEKLL